MLRAFIAKFSDSFYAELAKAKLEELIKKGNEKKVSTLTPVEPPKPSSTVASVGLSIAPLTEQLRQQHDIDKSVRGVLIMGVDPKGLAAEKGVKPGEVIVEVTQNQVSSPEDVFARFEAVKRAGRSNILLLVSTKEGYLRFVVLPLH